MQDYENGNFEFRDQNIAKSCFDSVKHVSDIEWICKTCHRSLLNLKLPSAYLLNSKFRGISSETTSYAIDTIKKRLTSPRLLFMST